MNFSKADRYVNPEGTTPQETFAVILPVVLYTFLSNRISIEFSGQHTKQLAIDFTFIIIPIILTFTILVEQIWNVLITLSVLCAIAYISVDDSKKAPLSNNGHCNRLNFITNARSAINVLTAVAILAVDFSVFPRRFSKTDEYGYSLMDVGVGLFVYSNGIVVPQIKGRKESLVSALKNSLPLIVLGCIRWFVTKEIDYHVPVSEYGVHWNFFITLAITKIISSLILITVDVNYIFVSAFLLLFAHETLLQIGLARFVLKGTKRDNFITANREGIVSILGYLALHFFSISIGKQFYNKRHLLKRVLFITVGLLIGTLLLQTQFGVSRRLANSAYCLWILFIGSSMTGLFYLCEILQHDKNTVPLIFEAVNYNGLAFFLVSNLLTGLVNIVLKDTFALNATKSVTILIIYMFSVSAIICTLYLKRVKLKL